MQASLLFAFKMRFISLNESFVQEEIDMVGRKSLFDKMIIKFKEASPS